MKNTGFKRLTIDDANTKQREYDERRRNKPKSKAAIEGKKRSTKRRNQLDAREEQLRKKVRERDGNQCRWVNLDGKRCEYTDPYIAVHHVNERSQRPDEKYNPENCVCLCDACHDRAHHTVQGRQEAKAQGLLGGVTYEAAMKERA